MMMVSGEMFVSVIISECGQIPSAKAYMVQYTCNIIYIRILSRALWQQNLDGGSLLQLATKGNAGKLAWRVDGERMGIWETLAQIPTGLGWQLASDVR